jgi:hypothetical protein
MNEENDDTATSTAQYSPSADEVEKTRRRDDPDGTNEPASEGRDFTGGASEQELAAYVGVDPIYRNHGSLTSAPLFAPEGSVNGDLEDRFITGSDAVITGRHQEEEAVLQQPQSNSEITTEDRPAGIVAPGMPGPVIDTQNYTPARPASS